MRLIDADIVRERLCKALRDIRAEIKEAPFDYGEDDVVLSCIYEIDEAPTVDAVPVGHAHWLHYPEIREPGSAKRVMCSSCRSWAIGYPEIEDYAYCPNCGLKMERRWRNR